MDISFLIQGKLLQSTYDFYLKNYKNNSLIFSTWKENNIILNESSNSVFLENNIPEIIYDYKTFNYVNAYYQIISTLNGLKKINTKFTVKIRGDEEYSNLNSIYEMLNLNEDSLYTSSIFFRKWNYENHHKYHISDHIIAGKTEDLLETFDSARQSFDDGKYFNVVESFLYKNYLKIKYNIPLELNSEEHYDIMKKNVKILDLKEFEPYKIVANCLGKTWINDFIPENENSISRINDL